MRDDEKTFYQGTGRRAFLPGNEAGTEALGLLIECFNRRHSFIVGDSVTTGAKNVVVWSGVHHKTNTHDGSSNFGYPDETYLDRLKEELKARALGPEDITTPVPLYGSITI